MTDQNERLSRLFTDCWKDDALKARFMSDPKVVMAEYDIPVPEGMDVKVVENADDRVHITMPQEPADAATLPDEDLTKAAGGCASLRAGTCGH